MPDSRLENQEQPEVELEENSDSPEEETRKGAAGKIRSLIEENGGNIRDAWRTLGNFFKESPVGKDEYNRLEAKGLTPDELEKSKLSDNFLQHASVKILSEGGNEYNIVYGYGGITFRGKHENHNSNVGVFPDRTKEVDMDDFEKTYWKIKELNDGYFFDERTEEGKKFDPGKVIQLKELATQQKLAEIARKYEEEFESNEGINVSYEGLSEFRSTRTELPVDKLTFNQKPLSDLEDAA